MTRKTLKKPGFGQRRHAETFMSGSRGTMGNAFSATTERGLMTEARVKVLACAIQR